MPRLRRGVTGILVALAIIVLLVAAAFAADWGIAYFTKHQLQNFVDASALAGAQDLPTPAKAKAKAAEYYAKNYAENYRIALPPQNIVTCPPEVTDPNTTCYTIASDEVQITTPYTKPESKIAPKNLIHVKACREVRFYFAPVIGVRSIKVCAKATASRTGMIPRGMVVLDPTGGQALFLKGNARVYIDNGCLIVDSSASDALYARGGVELYTQQTLIVGNYRVGGGAATLSPTPLTNQEYMPDPLAHLKPPDPKGMPTYPGGTFRHKTFTLKPGIYTGLVDIGVGATVYFEPGIYIFKQGISADSNSNLYCSEVFFYIEGGGLTLTSGGTVRLSPPTSGYYEGILIFQARNNSTPARFHANALWISSGTLYFPDAQVALSGTVRLTLSMLIAYRVSVESDSELRIYVEEPPSIAEPPPAFLLED